MSELINKLTDLHKQATEERSHFYTGSVIRESIAEIKRLEAECAELKEHLSDWSKSRVEAAEYQIIDEQKTEITQLREQLRIAKDALGFIVEHEAKDGSNRACTFCDMGEAGLSTKGPNHHDDWKHICPVYKASEALKQLSATSAADNERVKNEC